MSTVDQTRPATGRRVHWLELFFDLVMVAYIGQIAHTMHGEPGWTEALVFFALLATAWWAWVNASITMSLFGARVTPSIWVAVTIAMIALGVMAAAVPDALGDRAAAFAIGNAVIRVVWAMPWLLKRRTIGQPWWRPVLYSFLPASLWVISAFVAPPGRYVLWMIAIAIEIAMLSVISGQADWLSATLDLDHMIERISLLVVIVLGESILSIIGELESHWALLPGITAVLGFLAVAMIAWIFFGYATTAVETGLRRLQQQRRIGGLRDTIMYLPFLLIAGILLLATGLGTAVAEAGEHLSIGSAMCLAGGICLFYVSSVAESLRYGAPWRHVVLWGPAGIILPWVLVPLSSIMPAAGLVGATVLVIAVMALLTDVNARRIRVDAALSA